MNREIKDLIYSIISPEYIEVDINKSPIVLSAPHGGGAKPISIPKRKYGNMNMDTYTRRATNAIRDSYKANKPSTVISNIHRNRVDFNRALEEGTQGNRKAIDLWLKWNRTLKFIIDRKLVEYKRVLYLDIHSHNENDEFELGYNLNTKPYLELEETGNTKKVSSLDSLGFSKYDMIFGEYSFKHSLELFGLKVMKPAVSNIYFNGGRNIEVFSGEGVGAIQIEIPVSVLKTDFNYTIHALKFAIETFRKYFVD